MTESKAPLDETNCILKVNFPLFIIVMIKSNSALLILRSHWNLTAVFARAMFVFASIFADHSLTFGSKLLVFLVVFNLFALQVTDAEESSGRERRAIGGESFDPSNFVLYVDESTGMKFIEVPYVFMQRSLNDQRMWRTVRGISLSGCSSSNSLSSGRSF